MSRRAWHIHIASDDRTICRSITRDQGTATRIATAIRVEGGDVVAVEKGPSTFCEHHHPSLFWLSFADAERAEGQQFLGVAIVEAQTLELAIHRTHVLGINPGGGVHSIEIHPAAIQATAHLADVPRDTLLNWAQLDALGLEPTRAEGFG